MSVRALGPAEFDRLAVPQSDSHHSHNVEAEPEYALDLLAQIENAAEEMADLLSSFGRFSKIGRKNDNVENDFLSAMLEEKADEKIDILIKHVAKMSLSHHELLSYARSLFPNDCDLMLALREMLLSRKLSEIKKKKIKEAIEDLKKFVENEKIKSGMNVGSVAKRFSHAQGSLSADELRSCYLRFLTLDIPSGYIYQDWIDQYGCHYRKRLLAFTLNALLADMKSSEPGIHFDEFGPLCSKLSDARVIYTLDLSLNEQFEQLSFYEQIRNDCKILAEADVVTLYLVGLLNYDFFEKALQDFNKTFMSNLQVKQRAVVIQLLRNIYNITPDSIYAAPEFRPMLLDYISSLLTSFHEKEQSLGSLGEYYK